MGALINRTGHRFGKLVVIRFVSKNKYGKNQWLCRCDCGNEKIILGDSLSSGRTKSCGCLHHPINRENLSNKKFGRLTPIKFLYKNKFYRDVWLCKCDCGNKKQIEIDSLLSKETVSCGCFRLEKFKSQTIKTIQIKKGEIHFPSAFWVDDCEFARIKLIEPKMQIEINPINSEIRNAKGVRWKYNKRGEKNPHRRIINTYEAITSTLDIIRPIIQLRNRAGFVIQFLEDDKVIFNMFKHWINSNKGKNSFKDLVIYANFRLSVPELLWPNNAEYIFPEKTVIRNKQYLDIFPVSRTGFIVNTKLEFLQYLGLENCKKVTKKGNRIIWRNQKFLNENKFTLGEYHLQKTLPDGRMRFKAVSNG